MIHLVDFYWKHFESVEEDSLVTLFDDGVEDDESFCSLELPHAAKVSKQELRQRLKLI